MSLWFLCLAGMNTYNTPVTNQAPTALLHYDTLGALTWTSIFSADTSGNLWETYLPAISDSWATQDMYANAKIPVVSPFPSPSALVHYDTSGGLTWTSVFTVDFSNGDVRESYLPVMGDSWSTQDLPAPNV
jgi:hypothetical protein